LIDAANMNPPANIDDINDNVNPELYDPFPVG